jgi:hypothetical protein
VSTSKRRHALKVNEAHHYLENFGHGHSWDAQAMSPPSLDASTMSKTDIG